MKRFQIFAAALAVLFICPMVRADGAAAIVDAMLAIRKDCPETTRGSLYYNIYCVNTQITAAQSDKNFLENRDQLKTSLRRLQDCKIVYPTGRDQYAAALGYDSECIKAQARETLINLSAANAPCASALAKPQPNNPLSR